VAAAAVGVSVATDDDGSPGFELEPATEPREDLTIRALGDSVTAGFGYYADGSPVRGLKLLSPRCLPPQPPDGRCQSPDRVAYPAVAARRLGVPLQPPFFENLAIAGSTPGEWLGSHLGDELEEIVAADPDLTVLTLGANPLLQTFLIGRAFCARTPFVGRCVEEEIEEHRVAERLATVLERLLATDPQGRRGEVVVFAYHETRPLPSLGARVSALLDRLNETIAAAVARVRAARPRDARRLILVSPPPFRDHECFEDEPWVLLTDSCIHPNAEGHRAFAAALLERIEGLLPEP